jgi:hypothetical protein
MRAIGTSHIGVHVIETKNEGNTESDLETSIKAAAVAAAHPLRLLLSGRIIRLIGARSVRGLGLTLLYVL